MEPLLPPHPAPPPPASVAPPPPVASVLPVAPVTPVAPVSVAPPPPIDHSPSSHAAFHSQNLHEIGDETFDTLFSPSNPYRMNGWDWVFIIGTALGFVSCILFTELGLLYTIILYVSLVFWGYFLGSISWYSVGQWSVQQEKGLKLWRWKWFPIKCFRGDAKMIRIDSFAMENRPGDDKSDIIFSIHQAKVASYLCFGLLFVFAPELSKDSVITDLIDIGFLITILSPLIGSILVPMYIFSDSSVVEVIPEERDFAPVGMTLRTWLKKFVRWALFGLVSIQLIIAISSSGLGENTYRAIITMLILMSWSATTVVAASFSYPNEKHFRLVEIFNDAIFDLKVDQDHTFKQIDTNSFIVMPKHLINDTIEFLRETRGDDFAHVPQNPVNPSLVAQTPSPPPVAIGDQPPPPPPASLVYNVGAHPPSN